MSDAGTWEQLLARWEHGAGPRIASGGRVLDASDLVARVGRAAGWLAGREVASGDRVVLQLPRSPEFLELFLGAWSIGAVPVPLHPRATDAEVGWVVEDCAPRVTLRPSDPRASADAPPPPTRRVTGEDPACILYTSGTTGRPKGAVLRHRNVVAGLASLHAAWEWRSDDALVHALPYDHVHGLFVAQLAALWAGATTVLLERFEPDAVWDALEAGGTIFMGVPTFYHRLLGSDRAPDLRTTRLFTCGSAPLPSRVLLAFERRFGHRILERYGMTEIGIALSNPLHGERRAGSIGLPLPGVSARIAGPDGADLPDGEVGELRVRGPTVFAGYLGRPDATAAALRDGEMCTGDLGLRARDGYFVLTGRAADVILTGGLNVYPREVETALCEDPAIAEAVVVGTPDADLGEVPAALLVLRPGAAAPTPEAMTARLRAVLSPFKIPRIYRFTAALPRNAMGKVVRRAAARLLGPILVRDARPDEAAELADRNVAMARETEDLALDPAVALAGAQAVFARDVGARYFVAEAGGVPVGQLMITVEWSDWRNATVWWIQSVYVEPAHRGSGVFRALYDEALRRAAAAGAQGVRLYVDRRNTSAIAVYRRLGMDGDHYLVFERFPPG
jgi:malonyl-CoA/methylmalonyl-CoA synthetase